MRFLKIILATTILFFAVKPGIDLIVLDGNTQHSCCVGKCSPIDESDKLPEQKDQNDDCSGELCNPFQACGCCILLCSTQHSMDLSKPDISVKQKFSYQSFLSSQFSYDFWNPPKIA